PVTGGAAIATVSPHDSWLSEVGFSSDGLNVLTATRHGKVSVWTRAGGLVREFGGKVNDPISYALSPDGQSLITENNDGAGLIRVWPTSGSAQTYVSTIESAKRPNYWDRRPNKYAISADGTSLVSGSPSGAVRLRRLDKAKPEIWFDGHSDGIWAVAMSPDG